MSSTPYLDRLSFQLYSARSAPALPDLLTRLAALGYGRVEPYGGQYADLDNLADALERAGLAAPSGHFGLAMVRDDPEGTIAVAQRLGMKFVFIPAIPPQDRPKDASGWRDFGAHLAELGKPLIDAGLQFGWHNHDFEFAPLPDGSLPITHMFEAGDCLVWEADLGWIARAGQDPLFWLDRYAPRIVAAHVKDIAPGVPAAEDGWADIGHGTLDWTALAPACLAAGAELLVLEHDAPSDYDRFAARSIAAVTAW